jgi:probable F420-dependent oxidoreductase
MLIRGTRIDMKFGVCVPNYGTTVSAEGLKSVAVEAEALGYDSVWTTDHVLMPRDSGTPYERVLDCIASLAYLAGQTEKIRLGISSLIIAMRNPVVVAKQLASVDAFSDGRLLLAIGAGWNEKEFSFVGSDFHTRGARVDESIRLLRSLWKGETTFSSRKLSLKFEKAAFEPEPTSKKIEIWTGGASAPAMRRAAELADAWHPNVYPMETFGKLVSQFRAVSPKAKSKRICVRVAIDSTAKKAEYVGAQGEKRIMLTGNAKENAKVLSELESLGVSYAVLACSPEGNTTTKAQIESIRSFAKKFV